MSRTRDLVSSSSPLRRDFRLFLTVVWRKLGLPSPTAAQYDIARYMQYGPRRKLIMAFRGVGKSWIFSAYIAWLLWRDPDLKVLVVSATKPAADQIASFVRRLIFELPHLRGLRPRVGQRVAVSAFDVGPARAAKDPSLRAVGVNGQITGSRADVILADDIETQNNATTAASRARLAEQVREFDAVLKPGGAVTYLGTPQSTETVYAALPQRGYAVRIWPAEIPAAPAIYQGCLAPFVMRRIQNGGAAGDPIDPERFGDADLSERRASFGPAAYALQFLLDARDLDAGRRPLKLSDVTALELEASRAPMRLVWSDDAPTLAEPAGLGLGADAFRAPTGASADWGVFTDSAMAIDPSGRGKDETAYAVVKSLNGMMYLTASGGFDGGYDDTVLAALAAVGGAAQARRCVVEADFGDGMFTRLLAPAMARAGWRGALVETRAGRGQKERRILDLLEPLLAQHRFAVDMRVVWADAETAAASPDRSLFHQLTRVTRARGSLAHDDRLDALAMAVASLGSSAGVDPDRASEQARAKRLKADLKDVTASLRDRLRSVGPEGTPQQTPAHTSEDGAQPVAARRRRRGRGMRKSGFPPRRWT